MLGRSVALTGVYDRWLERIKTWMREQREKAETDAVFDEYERQRRLFEEAGRPSEEPSKEP